MANKKIGRNDPCPCGSGKKYKKCCLRKDEEARARAARTREDPYLDPEEEHEPEPEPPLPRMAFPETERWPAETLEQHVYNCLWHGANTSGGGYGGIEKMDWLDRPVWDARIGPLLAASDFYLKEIGDMMASVLEFCFYGGDDAKERCRQFLQDEHQGLAELCFAEHVLSDAEPSIGPELLRRAGLAPQAEAVRYLESLSGSSLSLYEVQAVQDGFVLLADLIDESLPPVWADVRNTGLQLLQWDIAALRLLSWQGTVHAGVGALFFERIGGLKLARTVRTKAKRHAIYAKEGEPHFRNDTHIVEGWLAALKNEDEIEVVPSMKEPTEDDLFDLEYGQEDDLEDDLEDVREDAREDVREDAQEGVRECVVDVWRLLADGEAIRRFCVESEDMCSDGLDWMLTVPAPPGDRAVVAWLNWGKKRFYSSAHDEALADAAKRILKEKAGHLIRFESRTRGDSLPFIDRWRPDYMIDQEGADEWDFEWLTLKHLALAYEPLEALGGRSIARCAGMKTMRGKAAEWLKHFENAEARRGSNDLNIPPAPLELDWLWDHLGLERWPEPVRALLAHKPEA